MPSGPPNGATIAFISDVTGEDEIYTIAQDGTGEPKRLTEGFAAMLHGPTWSPDSKRIAFGDKDRNLYVVNVEDKKLIQGRAGPQRPDRRLRLVAQGGLPGLLDARHERPSLPLHLVRRGRKSPPDYKRLQRRIGPRVGSGR